MKRIIKLTSRSIQITNLISKKIIIALARGALCWFFVICSHEKPHGIKRKAVDSIDWRASKKTPTLKYAQGLLREGIANFNYNQVREALATYRALAKAPETLTLLEACRACDLKIVQLLVDEGANPNKRARPINTRNDYETSLETPLIAAVDRGDEEIIVYLLNNGADINLPSSYGSPLTYAIFTRQPALAIKLVERGAHVNFADPRDDTSPLALALLNHTSNQDSDDLIAALLNHGAVINSPHDKKSDNGYHTILTPMEAALCTHNNRIAKYFIQKEPVLTQKIEYFIQVAQKYLNEEMLYIFLAYPTERHGKYFNAKTAAAAQNKVIKAIKIKNMLRAKQIATLEID